MRAAMERLRAFWSGSGGGREVLALSYPLILGQMTFTLQVFIDRLFLTWYSLDAVAGAVTALFVVWTPIGLCIGTGEYVTTFVAQYFGASRHERIGPTIWQGVYFCLAAGIVIACLSPFVEPFFAAAGHTPEVLFHETRYARILLWGAFPIVLMPTLSTFFAGRGETRAILICNILSTLLDSILNWAWIFGHWGFPRAGAAGAAWSTVVAQVLGCAFYAGLMLRRPLREKFQTLKARFEPALFARVVRYGLPSGLQYSIEIGAFALFMMIIGRIGTAPLAASGIAFNLNMIVFMPLLGLGVAVSSLVGRYLGAERPDLAERSTLSAVKLATLYMGLCGLLYVGAPRLLLAPYMAGADKLAFAPIADLTVVLLRFVALYSIFDTLNVTFAAGIKGAGDTRYPMLVTTGLALFAMLVPCYLACVVYDGGVYLAWSFASLYVVLLGLAMWQRFAAGGWKKLRVIEPHVPELDSALPDAEPA